MTRSISAYPRLAVKPIDTSERTGSDSRFERQVSNRVEDLHPVPGLGPYSGLGFRRWGEKRILGPAPPTPALRQKSFTFTVRYFLGFCRYSFSNSLRDVP